MTELVTAKSWDQIEDPRVLMIWLVGDAWSDNRPRHLRQALRWFVLAAVSAAGDDAVQWSARWWADTEQTDDPPGRLSVYDAARHCAGLPVGNIELSRYALQDPVYTCRLIRETVGNPFRPLRLPPQEPPTVFAALPQLVQAAEDVRRGTQFLRRDWLTPDVLRLATACREGDWDAASPLADALEDAGCTADSPTVTNGDTHEIVRHLRWNCLHIPGCYVIQTLCRHSPTACTSVVPQM